MPRRIAANISDFSPSFYKIHLMSHAMLSASLFGVCLGLAAHHFVFINGEWHIQSPTIIVCHGLAYLCLSLSTILEPATVTSDVLSLLTPVFHGYLAGLTTSILIYRCFFHRLTRANIRGPWYSKLSTICNVWAARHRKYYLTLHALHEKYGDFVRTGPAEIAVFDPAIFVATDGPRSECIKSEFYDVLLPRASLLTTRNKALHAVRRREWSTGFSSKAIGVHMSRIIPYIDKLEDMIEADVLSGQPSKVSDYLYWFGFDAMGEFVFGRSFGMLENRKMHHIIQRLQSAIAFIGPLMPASWIVHAGLHLLPRISKVRDWFDSMDWCEEQMRQRVADSESALAGSNRDLTYYLMEQEKKKDEEGEYKAKQRDWLGGDSLLAIIAGSDPSTSALIAAFCELGRHPDQAEKVFQEVSLVDNINDIQQLRKLRHLSAVINETMRLYPALLSGGSRKTTSKGITVAGQYIPPETTIISPRYTIGRRSDCFEDPEKFIPERWTTRPDMVRNSAAFSPFGTGVHSCLGRVLAEDMMMCVIARLVKKYRFYFAAGETGDRVMNDMTDQFVPYPGALSLFFEKRSI